jgi:hypothetical protein
VEGFWLFDILFEGGLLVDAFSIPPRYHLSRGDTELPHPAVGRCHHTAMTGQGTNHHRAATAFATDPLLDAGIEGIEIGMSDPALMRDRLCH